MEEEAKFSTGAENTYSFMSVWVKYNDVASFLASEEHIAIRSTTVSENERDVWLNFSRDVDGVSIEWEKLGGTSHIFHHLRLAPRDVQSLKKVYPMLKKHDDLAARNETSLKVLKSCVGTQLFYDNGWEYYLCLLPEVRCRIHYDEKVVRNLTLIWLKELRVNLKQGLKRCLEAGNARGTLDKNNLNDMKSLFILPSDSAFVLELLDKCIAETVPPQGLKKCVLSFRFGEKNTNVVRLPIRDKSSVLRIFVHSAVLIGIEDDEDTGLFWSREGIRLVAGNRGTISSAMSFNESCNFQSNLDGKSMDVKSGLRKVCAFPGRVHFVQLYADTPHRYPGTRFHPVSAAILIGRGLKAHSSALDGDATAYLSEIENNFLKVRSSKCRMEFVFSLPDVRDTLDPKDYIAMDSLYSLLERHPMLVPFVSDEVSVVLRKVGHFFTQELKNLFDTYRGSGHSEAVWQAYQYELAVEKLLWGKPLCWQSYQHAINLGIGLGYPTRSLTDERGFLCLANKLSSCENEDTCPPLGIFTGSETLKQQVKKMFGFEDYLDGSALVLGRRFVMVMLQDFYDAGVRHERFNAFYAHLKETNSGLRVAGRATVEQIAGILTETVRWKVPMISHHLIAVLTKKGRNVKETLRYGVEATGIKYFPAVRRRDDHGNAFLNWQAVHGVWLVTGCGEVVTSAEKAALMCSLIVTELESRKLCFTSRTVATTDTFPWVLPVLKKLRCRDIGEVGIVRTLTFVTCIAYLQDGRYVRYSNLSNLEMDMPLSQRDLGQFEILGKFILPNVNSVHVWRLHHSIPGMSVSKGPNPRLVSTSNENTTRPTVPNDEHYEAELPRIRAETDTAVEGERFALKEPDKHLPNGVWRKWTCEELALVGLINANAQNGTSVADMYKQYVEECRKAQIPDRSLKAFTRKVKRLRYTT